MAPSSVVDEAVYMAKLSEQAERYEGMVTYMNKVAKLVVTEQGGELSIEQRNLLSVAYKNVIGARRASWRIVSSIEQKEDSKGNDVQVARIKTYREKVTLFLAKTIPQAAFEAGSGLKAVQTAQ